MLAKKGQFGFKLELSITEFCSKLAFISHFPRKYKPFPGYWNDSGERELRVCSVEWRELYVTDSPPGLILQLTKSWKLA